MQTIIVTGSSGLIGSETAKRFAQRGLRVVGIDNDLRAQFFGAEASTKSTRDELVKNLREYEHHELDIRDAKRSEERRVGKECRYRWSQAHEKKKEKM